MTPYFVRRCDVSGADITCLVCRGLASLPVVVWTGVPGSPGAGAVVVSAPCFWCGGSGSDPTHRLEFPFAPFVDLGALGVGHGS